jgi:replication factor C subunit 2/4
MSDVASKLSWTEKYRPKEFHQVHGQPRAVALLRGVLYTNGGKTMPHLMLCGPAGTGKTSLINVLICELYGGDLSVRERARYVLELNASKDRGIDVMRARVKVFAAGIVPAYRVRPKIDGDDNTKTGGGGGGGNNVSDDVNGLVDKKNGSTRRVGGRMRCGFKLVVLDEADRMTVDAQTSLRMTIEMYSEVTRYAILCNRQSSMVEALQSRCTPVPFRALVEPQIEAILRRVIKAERLRIEHEPRVVSALALQAKGDARRAIGFLQSAAATCDYDCITMHDVNDVTTRVHEDIVHDVLRQCCGPAWQSIVVENVASVVAENVSSVVAENVSSVVAESVSSPERSLHPDAKSVDATTTSREVDVARLMRLAQKVCADGYAIESFLDQLSDLAATTVALADPHKWSISQSIALASHRLTTGADQEIQLTFVLVDIARQCILPVIASPP